MTFSRANTRVVRKVLADGSTKTYRYGPRKPPKSKREGIGANSIAALLRSYRLSPEWTSLSNETRANYNYYFRVWDDRGKRDLSTITLKGIIQIRNSLAQTSGHGAANVFVRVTATLMNWARVNGWILVSPAAGVGKLESGKLPAWTEEQAEVALAKLPEALRRVVVLGLHTGQRRSDLIKMRWTDVKGGTLTVKQQKTGVTVILPIGPELEAEFGAWRSDETFGFILKNTRGDRWNPTYLSTALPKALQKAELPKGLNVHGMRKLMATRLANAGCSTHEIASVTGHKTLAMIQHYTLTANQEGLAQGAVLKLQTKMSKLDKLTG